ncbi:cytochrome P450 [Nocardiopsis sediminis]|uniref:Cytochrome P450 n=1 Tax=Nocardiopsis sediminis TaxID=1778267 RepID=A0ABV8FXS5_9ACTN
MTSRTDQIAADFPPPRACPMHQPAEYERRRTEEPIAKTEMPGGGQAWLVTTFDDVRAALADPRLSSDRRRAGFPRYAPTIGINAAVSSGGPFGDRPLMIGLDGEEHARARRAVLGEFTVKRMRALKPRIQEIVDDHIDAMLGEGSPADLVQALSLPVPSLVICEQLGVPYADHDFFQTCTTTLLSWKSTSEQRRQGLIDLFGYIKQLCSAKEQAADPGDDLIGRQILKQREEGEVDHQGLVATALILLIAGHETTANMISLGTVALIENPDVLGRIRDDPELTPAAVEELLRFFSITGPVTSRVATSDIEIGGVTVREGEGVVALLPSANHDATVFADPATIDIDRGARHHVAFGYGAHQCLGQNLARLELQIVFDTLFRRVPDLRFAVPLEELPFKSDSTIYGLHKLPVVW